MNQALKESLGIVVRAALLMLATWLKVDNVLEPYAGEIVAQLVPLLMAGGTLAYQQLVNYFKRQKLMTALSLSIPVSEAKVEAMVKDPDTVTPSVATPKSVVPS